MQAQYGKSARHTTHTHMITNSPHIVSCCLEPTMAYNIGPESHVFSRRCLLHPICVLVNVLQVLLGERLRDEQHTHQGPTHTQVSSPTCTELAEESLVV